MKTSKKPSFKHDLWSWQTLSLILLLGLAFYLLILQAFKTSWRDSRSLTVRGHLQMDVVNFSNKIQGLLATGSLANAGYNEYQPGAVFYFLLPALGYLFESSFAGYLSVFIGLNFLWLLILTLIFKDQQGLFRANLFILMVFLSGPMILFRFELLVVLLLVLSILYWQKQRFGLGMVFLGLAVSLKVYPIIILPYLLALLIRKKKFKKTFKSLVVFSLVNFLILTSFLVLGGSWKEVSYSLKIHSALKPVGVESILGTVLSFLNKLIKGSYPQGRGSYGIFGLKPEANLLPNWFLNQLWLPALTLFYFFLFSKTLKQGLKPEWVFLIINLFLIFYKALNPQYFYWYLPLFFLFNSDSPVKNEAGFFLDYSKETGLIMVIVFLTQLIYPYLYNILLDQFYTNGKQAWTFYCLAFRNFLVIALFLSVLKKTLIELGKGRAS